MKTLISSPELTDDVDYDDQGDEVFLQEDDEGDSDGDCVEENWSDEDE